MIADRCKDLKTAIEMAENDKNSILVRAVSINTALQINKKILDELFQLNERVEVLSGSNR